ncbi:MAG: diversity-generating retroelement protein Avd [Acidobacteriota bacterium]
MDEAPLFTRLYSLTAWLTERTQKFPKSQRFGLAARIDDSAYTALEGVTLALRGFDRVDNLDRADAALAVLRVYLRLATDARLLQKKQLLFAIAGVDEVGRMIGGWKKRL